MWLWRTEVACHDGGETCIGQEFRKQMIYWATEAIQKGCVQHKPYSLFSNPLNKKKNKKKERKKEKKKEKEMEKKKKKKKDRERERERGNARSTHLKFRVHKPIRSPLFSRYVIRVLRPGCASWSSMALDSIARMVMKAAD